MKFPINETTILDYFKTLVSIPSPTGYSVKIIPAIDAICAELGYAVTHDNNNGSYITIAGEDPSKTVFVSSHLDTLGLMVRKINPDGTLAFRKIGGGNLATMEGESVTVHTRDGREYTGLLLCKYHSVHVFENAHNAERNEDTMMVLLDESVNTRAQAEALGISNGDVISIDPRPQITPNGYLKSRFIDDKAGVACCLSALKYMKENGLKPKYNTVIGFSAYEEVGMGGSYLPFEADEMVALDIGLIGPELDGNERKVSICPKDGSTIYDYDLTGRLIECAKRAEIPYAVDLFFRYGSDAGAARRAGNNVKVALCGMAVYGSHGMERTHVEGLQATTNLLLAYLLDI